MGKLGKVSNRASRSFGFGVTLAMALPSVVFAEPPELATVGAATRTLGADSDAKSVFPTGHFLDYLEHAHSADSTHGMAVLKTADDAIKAKLGELREATAAYRNINVALGEGFVLGINGGVKACVAHSTLGAMGYHYSRQDRFDDATINELEPEVLVYQTARDGSLKLGAVEWVVPKAAWEAVHGVGAPPPVVYGIALTVINPVLNWYVAHAWIWKRNPTGIIMDWNPKVTCP